MREIYFHLRDVEGKPRITICLLKNEETGKVISKGISICSFYDNPTKENGRERAKKRAFASLFAKRNLFPVFRAEAIKVVDWCLPEEETIEFKGVYNPDLNDKEKYIIDKTKPKIN